MPGLIECVYQPLGSFCSWVMLWERQHQEEIERAYAELERQVARQV